jgi:hypothetical protein
MKNLDSNVFILCSKKEDEPKAPMMDIIKCNKPEWPYITLGCFTSIIVGFSMPLFAVIFGDILGVSNVQKHINILQNNSSGNKEPR